MFFSHQLDAINFQCLSHSFLALLKLQTSIVLIIYFRNTLAFFMEKVETHARVLERDQLTKLNQRVKFQKPLLVKEGSLGTM